MGGGGGGLTASIVFYFGPNLLFGWFNLKLSWTKLNNYQTQSSRQLEV